MRRSFLAVALASLGAAAAAAVTGAPAAAQLPPPPDDPRLMEAYLAWDRGDYPSAVRGYLEVLRGPDGAAYVREVARLTGEVHPVRELAPDGGGLNIAADGRFVSFQVTEGDETVTKVVDAGADGAVVASVRGAGARWGLGGAVALHRERSTPEVESAREALDGARATGDRGAMVQASRDLAVARAQATDLFIRTSPDGPESQVDLHGQLYVAHAWSRWDGDLWVLTGAPGEGVHLLRVRDGAVADRFALGPQPARDVVPTAAGEVLVPLQPKGIARVRDGQVVGIYEDAGQPSLSAAGDRAAWVAELADGSRAVRVADLATGDITNLLSSGDPIANAALSPGGTRVAYQARPVDDWEIFAVGADGSAPPVQLSWEIQHDLFPTWIDETTVLAAKGEGRHRRSYLYDVEAGQPLKLFHNNTIRTIAPEYEWAVAPDGSSVAIVSERDGDTVSPERGVYLVDLTTEVGRDEVVARLEAMLAAEEDLRERGRSAFAPIAPRVREVTEQVDVTRIYLAARDLYRMGSKHITQPGNAEAIEYYTAKLRAYGYEPELQWFEPRPGIRTANVIARLPGTRDPDLVYVASSHFDSVERGPGADDDTSGGTALLEAARVMKDHPMPATIEFAFFTGEEAGLLGSREYVRRAVADGKHVVGALNNDMIGWANDHRLDNTIRYSNPGIRDIQHAAAMQFSELITYDALYYKNTDAHAYYEEYGDIVGGIGSYPVLGNPHYHQFTDRLETVSQRLVAEVSRTTVATLMLLASAPSRLTELTASARFDETEVGWQPAAEADVQSYTVRWTTPEGRTGEREVRAASGGERVSVALRDVPAGSTVEVRAVNRAGMAGWDWARAEVEGG